MKNVSIINTLTDNHSVQAIVEGDLVIRESADIKEKLLSLFENYRTIEIQFTNIEKLDISALQLLVAMYNSALAEQKTIKYFFEDSEYINSVLNKSGYNKFFSEHFSDT